MAWWDPKGQLEAFTRDHRRGSFGLPQVAWAAGAGAVAYLVTKSKRWGYGAALVSAGVQYAIANKGAS